MRINKAIAKEILFAIRILEKTDEEILLNYDINKQQLYRIKTGQTFKNIVELNIPTQINKNVLTEEEEIFCCKLQREGYSIKQIHIILGKGSYSTISRVLKWPHDELDNIIFNSELLMRLKIFDMLITPNTNFINKIENKLLLSDIVYMCFLSRMGLPFKKAISAFLPLIQEETKYWKHPINTEEQVIQYMEWQSSKSTTISILGRVHKNHIKEWKNVPFYYDDINIKMYDFTEEEKSIALNMINFDTKEKYLRRTMVED